MIALILLTGCQSSYLKWSYIQGHHTNIDYEIKSDSKIIQDVAIRNVYCYDFTGASMNPSLFQNNIVCLKEYKNETLEQGNIIHYTKADGDVIHRIIAVQPDVLIVQGDNSVEQEYVNRTQVKGILVATIYK